MSKRTSDMAGLYYDNRPVRLQVVIPNDFLMQPTRAVAPSHMEVTVLGSDTADVAKKLIAHRMQEVTRKNRPHHTFQLQQDGEHVPFWEPISKFKIDQPINVVVTQYDYNNPPPDQDQDQDTGP